MKSGMRLLCSALLLSGTAALAAECFDKMRGEIGIRIDTPGRTKITELVISGRGEKAFVAAEYLGSSNIRASIYFLMDERRAPELGRRPCHINFERPIQARNCREQRPRPPY